jgi:hypothetical protein
VLYQLSHTVFKSLQSTIRSFEYHYPIHPILLPTLCIPLFEASKSTIRYIQHPFSSFQKHYTSHPIPLLEG